MAGVTDEVYQQYLQMCPAAERGFVPRAAVEQWLGICQEDHTQCITQARRMERASTTGGIDSSPGGEATAEDGDVEVGFGHFDSTGNSSSRLSRALTLGNPMRRRSRTNSSAAAAENPPPFEGTDV